MSIAENLSGLRTALPAGVTLVAVSKTHPAEVVMEAYRAGQRVFGENRPQEMTAKQMVLPSDIEWHMIGHLQTNKVRLIAPFVSMIHSLDSAKLAVEISRQTERCGRVIDVLLEIRIAREESKHGWEWDELTGWLDGGEWRSLAGLRFRGVMGVASFSDDQAVVRGEFERLAAMFATMRTRFFGAGFDTPGFDTLSMGMSGDYPLAVECGSTMVRVGSAIFGARDYSGNV
ncbi:MAG: YggS family pyridoxal phosphate-dependent enzyme [Alistipes sp.]|jgi:pyridoxal phosphate enzyme (YggS family)|nr:YggS family pyridoxal phosphate-dependent enzyme [Alistipes sp.]